MKHTIILDYTTHGWQIGTGNPMSLPPGEYQITGRTSGMLDLLELDGKYHVLANGVKVEAEK